jgi:ribosomal protein L24
MAAPMHASNVMLIDPQSGQPTRVRRQDRRGRDEGADRREERAVDPA